MSVHPFHVFELERGQSLFENVVDINLSESGVHPVSVRELADMGLDLDSLLDAPLVYIQTNGTPQLREAVAMHYPGASADHIEITNGTAEANFILPDVLLEPGDEVLFQVPNYMQVSGIAQNMGSTVRTFRLRREDGWTPDWDEFERGLTKKTKLVYVSHPNNPTGAVLSDADMRRIVAGVERVGAWLIADQVYLGAEWNGTLSKSFWGMSDRVIVTSGLSKAFGIPGARIGWIVGPPAIVAECWARHDYTTISPGTLSDLVARFAVRPDIRLKLFARGRSFMGTNWNQFKEWANGLGGVLEFAEPRAGAYAFVRYNGIERSRELCDRIRNEHSVLIVPGEWMGLEHHLRFGLGGQKEHFAEGLRRITSTIRGLADR
mgnify:CR=1 FL=1